MRRRIARLRQPDGCQVHDARCENGVAPLTMLHVVTAKAARKQDARRIDDGDPVFDMSLPLC
jgi:hypothetical protein